MRDLIRAGADRLRARRDRADHRAHLRQRGVEAALERGEAVGQAGEIGGEIARREPRQRLVELADRGTALGLRLLEIDRDRQLHVEQSRLHHRDARGARAGQVEAAECAAPEAVFARDALEQILEHQSIGADIPARLEPNARMDRTDAAHAIAIGTVETAIGEPHPVRLLRRFGAAHMTVVAEEARGHRIGADAAVESIERGTDQLGDNGPGGGDGFALLRVEVHEFETRGDLLDRQDASFPCKTAEPPAGPATPCLSYRKLSSPRPAARRIQVSLITGWTRPPSA